MTIIGKIAAIEKAPTTIDEFYFWTDKNLILNPFDVIKVSHVNGSVTFGVVEEISHITDSPSYLSSFLSNDFGNVETVYNTNRIGMNYVKAKVVSNTKSIFTPVRDGEPVSLADKNEILLALGLDEINKKANSLPCGYLNMYEYDPENSVNVPVSLDGNFLIGPEGAHLNLSGISGLATKTSYMMFLLKGIQQKSMAEESRSKTAFVILNVKANDLLKIDQPNEKLKESDREIYKSLGIDPVPFKNVKYFYPYSRDYSNSNVGKELFDSQKKNDKAFSYKFTYERSRSLLDMLFANIDDPQQTLEAIVNSISTSTEFSDLSWHSFKEKLTAKCEAGGTAKGTEIPVSSWRKFKRILSNSVDNPMFGEGISDENREVFIADELNKIKANDCLVVDIARLNETLQSFVFGTIIKTVSEFQISGKDVNDPDVPDRIIIFVDELNKYASSDVPKNSPILRSLLDITERGRSSGIILFSAEQFKSAIHDRIKGNCSTHAYGRTNAIEISKDDYRFIPKVFKNMMTRLKPGEYILQHPVFNSLMHIKFPNPVYKND